MSAGDRLDLSKIRERCQRYNSLDWTGIERVAAGVALAEDVPALLEEVERLRAQLAAVEQTNSDDWQDGYEAAERALRGESDA